MDKTHKRTRVALLIIFMCTMMSGCVLRPAGGVKDSEKLLSDRNVTSPNLAGAGGKGLIRPVIPQDNQGDGETTGAGDLPSTPGAGSGTAVPGRLTEAVGQDATPGTASTGGDRKWEDQKAKQVALDLARKTAGVRRIKVCLAFRSDEWLIVLYRDAGSSYELKQYFWKSDLPEPEPFLVFERVPKDRLEEHLSRSEPDKACETIELPR